MPRLQGTKGELLRGRRDGLVTLRADPARAHVHVHDTGFFLIFIFILFLSRRCPWNILEIP